MLVTPAALIAALLAAVGACDRRPSPGGRAEAAADSALGDSAALASLPPTLARELGIGAVLTDVALADTAVVRCEPMSTGDGAARRRLRGRLADGSHAVLFVRARRRDGALQRVELVRRDSSASQRGFIWDAAHDDVQSVVWARAGAPRPETTTMPRGGPLPRGLRALGRRLLALQCGPRAAGR